jgi:acyl carrier protein phosphodiesterase
LPDRTGNLFVLNYLAHAYLSFGQTDILVGNMISDFVKGRKKMDYPLGIRKGIELHRAIDEFTDRHPITLEAKKLFKPAYGLYAGAFLDIVYDHYLANDRSEFRDDQALKQFSQGVYAHLEPRVDLFPERFQRIFPYMRTQDWLYHYQFKQHIYQSFKGLVARAKFIQEYLPACAVLDQQDQHLRKFYADFFPELKDFAQGQWIKSNDSIG